MNIEQKNKLIKKYKLTATSTKIYSILFLILGILVLIMSIPLFTVTLFGGAIFAIFGILTIVQHRTYRDVYKTCFKKNKENATSTPFNEPNITTAPVSQNSFPVQEVMKTEEKSCDDVCQKVKPIDDEFKIEKCKVSGTSFHKESIISLAFENDDYESTKKEIIDNMMTDLNLYQYRFNVSTVELIEEPDNEYDSNAIKVLADGEHIGYIPKEKCTHVKKLIDKNKIESISIYIGGGKFKCVNEEYDLDREKDVYTVEKGEINYFAELKLKIKNV